MRKGLLFGYAFAWILCFSIPVHALSAAAIFLSPSSGTYNVSQTFSVSVSVSSPDQAVNAVSGDIVYPADLLSVTSVSKAGSFVSLWVQEPTVVGNRVRFEGIALNPGYTGTGGRIITINFRAKAKGQATIQIVSPQILANDGLGTSILSGVGKAVFVLGTGEAETPTGTTPQPTVVTPGGPKITSETYPDPTKWYRERMGSFQWPTPSGVTGSNWVIDGRPSTTPSARSMGDTGYALAKIEEDGLWYFHVRLQNAQGWGETGHYPFRIDTLPPDSFEIKPLAGNAFLFAATDVGSGIEHYLIRIDEQDTIVWKDSGNHTFVAPALSKGSHALRVDAVDRAGNSRSAQIHWIVEEAPEQVSLVEYPMALPTDSWLVIRGFASPDTRVTVIVQDENDEKREREIMSDGNGQWMFISEQKIGNGTYEVHAEVRDSFGVALAKTSAFTLSVQHPMLWAVGVSVTGMEIAWGLMGLAVALLCAFVVYHRYRVLHLEKNMMDELKKIQQMIRNEPSSSKKIKLKSLAKTKLMKELERTEEDLEKRLKGS